MTSLKYKKGDVVRFTKLRVQLAREHNKLPPRWDNFVLANIDKPLVVKYAHLHNGNFEPIPMIILEGMNGYWNQQVVEPWVFDENNFEEDLFNV